jgi:hypothetical protein
MRLHRMLAAAALAIVAGAPLVASSPAFAQMFQEGLALHIPVPQATVSQPQASMPGGQGMTTQASKPNVQTAQVPDKSDGSASPAFVAPGVERNAAGQIERSL